MQVARTNDGGIAIMPPFWDAIRQKMLQSRDNTKGLAQFALSGTPYHRSTQHATQNRIFAIGFFNP